MNTIFSIANIARAGLVVACCSGPVAAQAVRVSRKAREFGVTLQQDRLAFESVAAYESIIDEATETTKDEFLASISNLRGFTSYAKQQYSQSGKSDGGLIRDPFFASIVNADLVVQVGANLIRVDPVAESVFVLPVADASQYDDLLNGNLSNKKLRRFSTDEDVLNTLAGAPSTQPMVTGPQMTPVSAGFSIGCSENHAGARESWMLSVAS